MKHVPKIHNLIITLTFLFLFIAGFPPAQTLAATPTADQVIFSFKKENITPTSGQNIHRVKFGIEKGSTAVPVCLTTSIEYNTDVFTLFTEPDLVVSSNISNEPINKTVTPNLSKNNLGILKVGVGVENYNDTPLPAGDLFYIDFKVKPGATPSEDDVSFNYDLNLGPNQASDKSARLLKVANDAGEIFNNNLEVAASGKKSGGGGGGSCFIGSIMGWRK